MFVFYKRGSWMANQLFFFIISVNMNIKIKSNGNLCGKFSSYYKGILNFFGFFCL